MCSIENWDQKICFTILLIEVGPDSSQDTCSTKCIQTKLEKSNSEPKPKHIPRREPWRDWFHTNKLAVTKQKLNVQSSYEVIITHPWHKLQPQKALPPLSLRSHWLRTFATVLSNWHVRLEPSLGSLRSFSAWNSRVSTSALLSFKNLCISL